MSRVAGVEGREAIGVPSDDGHAERFELLERAPEIEEGLRTRRHGHDRMASDREQVMGDVAGLAGVAMHTTDAAGREDLDPGACSERDRCRHGGDPDGEAGRMGMAEVAGRDLGRPREHPFGLVSWRDPDDAHAVDHGCHRRYGPRRPNRTFAARERFAVRRFGQTEGAVDRRLHRDDRLAGFDGGRDLVAESKDVGSHRSETTTPR